MKLQDVKPVSIVINTYNRAATLGETLKSFLYLDYPCFEVVVVNGPSTDNTEEILSQWKDKIKIGRCSEANLSVSRNIGIAQATGEFVAFIDDDAIPEPEWLTQAVEAFDSDKIGGAGGKVFNNTGYEYQYEYANCNRLGNGRWQMKEASPHYCFPYSFEFPYVQGTNAVFRRNALLEIGGFDEAYAYYHDETDVCLRLIDKGYIIRQLCNAFVHHKFAPSFMRNVKTYTFWYPVLKSKVYFAKAHAPLYLRDDEINEDIQKFFQEQRNNVSYSITHGFLPEEVRIQFEEQAQRAWMEGCDAAKKAPKFIKPEFLDAHKFEFKKFDTVVPTRQLTIVFFSEEYPPNLLGGIARIKKANATAIAALGHKVHVVTRSHDYNRVDFEDGVWVHRVVVSQQERTSEGNGLEIPQPHWDLSRSFYLELERISTHHHIDIVEAPIWNIEGIAVISSKKYPVVTSLHTTLKLSLPLRPDITQNPDTMRRFAEPVIKLEKYILLNSDGILANSNAIVREIEECYNIQISSDKYCLCPHGMPDLKKDSVHNIQPVGFYNTTKILYVGRLEKRKGIDILLDCIPELCGKYENIQFNIVGDDTVVMEEGETYRKIFESQYPELCGTRVIFYGKVSDDELKRHYAECDIFTAPSRFESFGLIYLEAMMFSKPVIGCDAGGIPEVVKQEETGLLTLSGDRDSLYAALVHLIENSEFRHELGMNGRRRYEEYFTEKRMALESVDYYFKVIDGTEHKPKPTHINTPPHLGLDMPYKIMANCKLLPNRDYALFLLPKGGIMAEIGVAYGDFSRKIIDNLNPAEFYSIDIFSYGPGSDFWDRTDWLDSNLGQKEFIENKFAAEINAGKFFTKTGLSWEVLETFDDNYFDYVYLDAGHDYESVKKDIDVLLRKIKNNGIIQFNDYTLYDWMANVHYGVVKAVDELLVNSGHEIMYFCLQKGGFNDIVVKIKKTSSGKIIEPDGVTMKERELFGGEEKLNI